MMRSLTLVRGLQQVAAKLKSAAVWNGSGLAVDATRDDFLYELSCYFRGALEATPAFKLEVAGATGTTKRGKPVAKWPKKPGKKENFSYLSVVDSRKGERFQLCPGIRVEDVHGKERAPDVILLEGGAPSTPTHVHVHAIWDAKYVSSPTARLRDTEVADFIFTYQQLGKPKVPLEWTQAMKTAAWRSSGLLTNGQASTEPTAALLAHCVSETHRYPDGPSVTRP